jgi:hypothetical protein
MVVCSPYSGIPRLHYHENHFLAFFSLLPLLISCICLMSSFFLRTGLIYEVDTVHGIA